MILERRLASWAEEHGVKARGARRPGCSREGFGHHQVYEPSKDVPYAQQCVDGLERHLLETAGIDAPELCGILDPLLLGLVVETQGQNGLQLLCHPQPSGLIF
ncbi:hypothetical protein WJX79_002318 [Trebouxia sp. C0005]